MNIFNFFKKPNRDYNAAIKQGDIKKVESYILESIDLSDKLVGKNPKDFMNSKYGLDETKCKYICESFYNLANEEGRKMNNQMAIDLYLRGLEYFYYPSAVSNLANILKLSRQFDACILLFDNLLIKNPEYIQGYLRLIKIAKAYDIKTRFDFNHYFDLYFKYGGKKEQVDFFINDPQALIAEREALRQAYSNYLTGENNGYSTPQFEGMLNMLIQKISNDVQNQFKARIYKSSLVNLKTTSNNSISPIWLGLEEPDLNESEHVYLLSISFEIDEMDYVVTYDGEISEYNDRDVSDFISQKLGGSEVAPEGAYEDNGKRYRICKWYTCE
jgi:hypothetical protein